MPLQVFPTQRTPVARSVALSKKELEAVNMLREYHYKCGQSLFELASRFGLTLVLFAGLPYGAGAVYNDEIWLKPIDTLTDRISFGHELHHVLFAPDAVAFRELSRTQIGRLEAKATLFGALFAVPSMPEFKTEDDVYRVFGPMNRDAAYYWISYYRKTGVEV